jgi:hypothetical protein
VTVPAASSAAIPRIDHHTDVPFSSSTPLTRQFASRWCPYSCSTVAASRSLSPAATVIVGVARRRW